MSHIIGIDPGLVHTGIVSIDISADDKEVIVQHRLASGLDPDDVKAALSTMMGRPTIATFIEGYRTRSNFGTDQRMVTGVDQLKRAIYGSVVLDNMGIKKVVTEDLMKEFKLWSFATPSHHQDLRSAARIGLLGMLKDPELNRELADALVGLLSGMWKVHVL